MPKKQIVWEKWEDPMKGNNFTQEATDPETPPIDSMITPTPFGILPMTEHSLASNRFDFWIMHSNFNLTKDILDAIAQIPGVETLEPYTRYRARIGFPKSGLFNKETVKRNIEDIILLKDDIKQQTIIDGLKIKFNQQVYKLVSDTKKLLAKKYKCWAIYVLPNGQIDIVSANHLGKEFTNKYNALKTTCVVVGGTIISSED